MASREAIVVLGCRAPVDGAGGALQRRADRAAGAFLDGLAPRVVVTGGRTWQGLCEAEWIGAHLGRRGVPDACVVLEDRSLNTAENARFSAALLTELGAQRIFVVTCDFHMRRALSEFGRLGFDVLGLSAPSPRMGLFRGGTRAAMELASGFIQAQLPRRERGGAAVQSPRARKT